MAKKVSRPRIVSKDDLEIDLPDEVTVALREIAATAKQGLLALSVGIGLQVVAEIFEEQATGIAGPKGRHDPSRSANRHGHERRHITLGGRKVPVERPRVRSVSGTEVALPAYELFASTDLLAEAAIGRMLAGLSTRRYRDGLEPVGDVGVLGTSRSAVSRRFVKGTQAKLSEVFSRDLSDLDLLACFIDGLHVGDHLIVVALGVDSAGRKHPLGLWEGSTENKATCSGLLANLAKRGLPTDAAMLYVIDGGKAIHAAITHHYGELALIQRCTKHKERNVIDHLPKTERLYIARKLRKAWANPDAASAERQLRAIAQGLKIAHPGAAASVLEGLQETLTVTRLGLSGSLHSSLKTTNPIESMISIIRSTTRNVKRYRSGEMALRWTAAGLLEAERQFRRLNGYKDLHVLKAALQAHEEVVKGGKRVA